MPYVRRGAAFRRGMGQDDSYSSGPLAPVTNMIFPFASACNWWDVACWTGIDTLISGQVPQNPDASGPNSNLPAIPPPVVPQQTPAVPPVDPNTGEAIAPPGYVPPMQQPYAPQYPDNPGGNVGSSPGTPCDWTQVSWLTPSAWCPTNWLIAAAAGIGLVFLFARGKH